MAQLDLPKSTITIDSGIRDYLLNDIWNEFQDQKCGYSDKKFDILFIQTWNDYKDRLNTLGLLKDEPEYKADIKTRIQARFGKSGSSGVTNKASYGAGTILKGGAVGNEYHQKRILGKDF